MKRELLAKFKETSTAVLPVAGVILLLNFTIAPMPMGVLALFLSSTVLIIIGMTLFQMGADSGMTPMGNQIGGKLVEMRNMTLFIVTSFILGMLVTLAEPDLQVLGKQMPDVTIFRLFGNDIMVGTALVYAVGFGVGLFLMFAVIRIMTGWSLSRIFMILYLLTFALAAFAPKDYLAVAFDSGGVTTGPITVPFILALGVGIASVTGGEKSQDNSFGLVGLCSVGPIITVLIMSLFINGEAEYDTYTVPEINSFADVVHQYANAAPTFVKEVGVALLPIIALYVIFQAAFLHLPKSTVTKTFVGVGYTFVGLVIFLTSVNVGFSPTGSFIGAALASLPYNWVIIPVGMLVGFFIVAAEPAVHVLNSQVEDVTGGAISKKAMMIALMIGMCVSVGLAMTRVITGISIWYMLIPGYTITIGLMFFVPNIFTAIAFDSGGVASGPMTATFLLPFALGACNAVGGNVLMDGFGVVAMVAMTPLVTIQILGAVYTVKTSKAKKEILEAVGEGPEEEEIEIIKLDMPFYELNDDELIEF